MICIGLELKKLEKEGIKVELKEKEVLFYFDVVGEDGGVYDKWKDFCNGIGMSRGMCSEMFDRIVEGLLIDKLKIVMW